MKIFLDTADTSLIEKHFSSGLIDGVTTNPTLIRKSGRDPLDVYKELKNLGIEDISMEVVGDADEMIAEGKRLFRTFGNCCTVKVPCSLDGLRACKELSDLDIKVNVTLIFSPAQAILASKAGATYVSPFVGRVDDNSFGGLCLVKDIVLLYKEHLVRTQVLAASLRGVRDAAKAFQYGADIVTMPPKVFEGMYNHILTDKGLELFEADWKSVTGVLTSWLLWLILVTYTIRQMTLTIKFKKDIQTLREAANGNFFLDVKNPKLFKKVKKYYERNNLIEFTGDSLDDYDILMEVISEDLSAVEAKWLFYLKGFPIVMLKMAL